MATTISSSHHALGSMSFTPDDVASLNQSSFPSGASNSSSPTTVNFSEQPSFRQGTPSATLPDFVFPARASPNSAPSSFSRATGRRPMSAYELGSGSNDKSADETNSRRLRPPPLPDFTFNSNPSSTSALASPPQSPMGAVSPLTSIPSRSAGHRRGTSELHGGAATSGAALLSTSPTRANASSLGPSAGRKGHSHRRSAAISSHDLSFILKPSNANATKIGGSAPTSPSDFEHKISPFPGLDDTATTPIESENDTPSRSSTATSPSGSPSSKSQNRTRVGFSDTLEYIPRPLSLVSSDTSSTVRGHSVSGSLSSIMSAGTSSPTSREQRGPQSPIGRPRTAGSVLDNNRVVEKATAPKRSTSTPMMLDLSASAPCTPAPSTPKWGFFSRSGESSPSRSRPASSASEKQNHATPPESEPVSPVLPKQESPVASVDPPVTTARRSSVSSRKSNKKQKKVKSWAGSILSRKSRPRSQKQKGLSRRSPTPPLRSYASMCEANDVFDFNGPASSQVPTITLPPKSELNTDFASWKPRQVRPQDEETMSPIIDLDAALGPFNTPSAYDPQWDASQRVSGSSKRRMHSAVGMGGFMGPGMHYHRRAESAPEMVPFDNPRFGLNRLGSSSTMADVFEEDEEDDDWEDTKAASDRGYESKSDGEDEESGLGIDIKVVDAENMHTDKPMDWTLEDAGSLQRGLKRKGSGLSEGERRQVSSSMKSEHSSTSLKDEPILEEAPCADGAIVLLDPFASRSESGAKSSDSSVSPLCHTRSTKDITPVDIQPALLSPAFLTPTSPNSSVPSPFPSPRSPYSDAHRISTAPSSFTEEHNYESLLLGEPGPEYRMSVDEVRVPSLTSSNSTITKESTANASTNNPQFRDGQRSASLSSAAVTRKRSSMASISRLISSSHGEKSKLSIESRPSSTIDVRGKEKESKSKRISRMMQFWKPKESA
ncbi:hypothetical protein BP5796_07409 [Coleophoma crateriformis]|uniref:Cell wall proline rich protein n=1 Tax=Coleophoma crateriformis TaxID=565419 RepID=A0A3D8RIU0_9HELO|nr:hypothetical protein BP5796_07409 [Coleophoma crateriformis]